MVYYAARNTGERRFEVQNLEGSENSGHPETVMADIHPLSADKLQRLMGEVSSKRLEKTFRALIIKNPLAC